MSKVKELVSMLEKAGASEEQIKVLLKDEALASIIKGIEEGNNPSDEDIEELRATAIKDMLDSARSQIDWKSLSRLDIQEAYVFFIALGINTSHAIKSDRKDIIGNLAVDLLGTTIDNMGGVK